MKIQNFLLRQFWHLNCMGECSVVVVKKRNQTIHTSLIKQTAFGYSSINMVGRLDFFLSEQFKCNESFIAIGSTNPTKFTLL